MINNLARIFHIRSAEIRAAPSSPFEANEFQRILRRFCDYSLDRPLDRLKGPAAAGYFLRSSCSSDAHLAGRVKNAG